MPRIRTLTEHDHDEVQSIWLDLFDDSQAFADWFFQHRFRPDTSVCLEQDGRIVSVIQGFPMRVRIRQVEVPAMMICGVSTLPAYRRRGYMHMLMQEMLTLCRREGFPAVLHKPVQFSTYRAFGQLPCTRTLRYTSVADLGAPLWQPRPPIDALTACYAAATARYSGCVVRTEADMLLKTEDYAADGAEFLTVWHGGRLDGYAVVFPNAEQPYAEEVLAQSPAAYQALLGMLPRGYSAKLPPDVRAAGAVYEQNAMGIADVSELLSLVVHDETQLFAVHDDTATENNGVFDGLGRPSAKTPQLTLTVGELMQGLVGFHPLGRLKEETCFCVDEY